MAIRRYSILASENKYSPTTGDTITYRAQSDTTVRSFTRAQPNAGQLPLVVELTVHIQYVDRTWGAHLLRFEGFIRDPRTGKANRVIGHHQKEYSNDVDDQHPIGLLEVTEDD